MKKCLTLTLIILAQFSFAQRPNQFITIYKNYKKGAYSEAITELKRIKAATKKAKGTKNYFLGLSHARLQDYDQATKYLARSVKYGNKNEDIYYELGQALYANNNLVKARKAFLKSSKINFKSPTSLYYVAHISQILEEYKRAKKYYTKVVKDKKTSKELKQVSYFQRAESILELARKKKRGPNTIKKHVIPQYQKVVKLNKESPVGKDAQRRIIEIQNEFGINPNKMVNGNRIPKKRHTLSARQAIEYDNNITLSNDTPDTSATQKDSYVYTTTLDASYKFVFKRRYLIEPGISFSNVKHQDQDNFEVYTNDSRQISYDLKTKFEHRLLGSPATLLLNIEYDDKQRKREENEDLLFNNETTTFTLGERFKYFSFGDTTLKFKSKSYTSYEVSGDFSTTSISLDQVVITKSGKLTIFLWQMDINDYPQTITNNTTTNLFRVDHIIPNFMFKTNLNLAMAVTLTSYEEANQASSRGTEKTYNPSFKVSRKINNQFEIDFSYSYTKNSSLESDQEYTKHVTGTELSFNF